MTRTSTPNSTAGNFRTVTSAKFLNRKCQKQAEECINAAASNLGVARCARGNQDGTFDIDVELLSWFRGKRIAMEYF